jgi:hypothetical protein
VLGATFGGRLTVLQIFCIVFLLIPSYMAKNGQSTLVTKKVSKSGDLAGRHTLLFMCDLETSPASLAHIAYGMFNPKILGAPATRSAFASVPRIDGLRVNTEGQVKR